MFRISGDLHLGDKKCTVASRNLLGIRAGLKSQRERLKPRRPDPKLEPRVLRMDDEEVERPPGTSISENENHAKGPSVRWNYTDPGTGRKFREWAVSKFNSRL